MVEPHRRATDARCAAIGAGTATVADPDRVLRFFALVSARRLSACGGSRLAVRRGVIRALAFVPRPSRPMRPAFRAFQIVDGWREP
ncbi:hypothetical protein QZM22_04440 [Burkholderia oklahomensis]|uniref:hypothetical protein n=1 Tax=Burkholderia oklahomensis TaxID=342113 RepID=UPI00264B68B4|nr:hypothetical protein [Burkholderia oklahomensis]MDN7671790.1 hypothetical protein [Burkholderia oklahomensis]